MLVVVRCGAPSWSLGWFWLASWGSQCSFRVSPGSRFLFVWERPRCRWGSSVRFGRRWLPLGIIRVRLAHRSVPL